MSESDLLPWTEKYRPKDLDNILSHKDSISALKTLIKNKCLPHLLFYGPPGTGKTSCIMACAKELYGKYYPYMVMELNASDDRGIEVVRSKIKQFITGDNVFFGNNPEERKDIFKLVILDEADAMTPDAQAILRKLVEKYTYKTRFCLICNYIQNINTALQSRCTKFRFAPLNKLDIEYKINDVAKIENIKITKSGIDTIIKVSNGDLRRVLNILQSTSMIFDEVNEKTVNNCLGYPLNEQIKTIYDSLLNDEYNKIFEKITNIRTKFGISLHDIMLEIHDILINLILTNNYTLLTKKQILNILSNLQNIELNQSVSINEDIQLGAFIGTFKLSN